jgi:hypothetical protein
MSIRPVSFQRTAILVATLGICTPAIAEGLQGLQGLTTSPVPSPVNVAQAGTDTGAGTGSGTTVDTFPPPRTTRDTFIGIAIGKPTYSTSCGNIAGLSCSNNGTSFSVTAGNMFTRYWGGELSYLDLGKADRAGGSVDARGVNLSVVGELPLGDSFSLQGKVGATYGVTHMNVDPLSGLTSGRASGVGLGYGLAFDVHFAGGLTGSVGWEQHEFHFAGQGMSTVKNITLGLKYRF